MKKCYFCARKPSLRITGRFRHEFVGHIYETDDPKRIEDIEANGFFGSGFEEIPVKEEEQEEVAEPQEEEPVTPGYPLDQMKFPALRALAKEKKLPGYGKMKKMELIEKLRELEE